MKEYHIFEENKKVFTFLETIKIEKDTKKDINSILKLLRELTHKNIFLEIDATVLKKTENIRPLLAFSFFLFKNKSSTEISFIKLKLNKEILVTPKILDRVKYISSKLTTEDSLFNLFNDFEVEENIYSYNSALNYLINSIVSETIEANKFNEEILNRHSDLPVYDLFEKGFTRKFNFSCKNTDLLTLYSKCFNRYNKIFYSATNPNPSFQRKLVWDLEKKKAFIESILNEIPLGSFYENKCPPDYQKKLGEGYSNLLWDGKQRMHSLHSFFLGEFPVKVEIDGKVIEIYYHQSISFFNLKIKNTSISIYESNFTKLEEIIQAYIYINKNQVKHTDEDLLYAENLLTHQFLGVDEL